MLELIRKQFPWIENHLSQERRIRKNYESYHYVGSVTAEQLIGYPLEEEANILIGQSPILTFSQKRHNTTEIMAIVANPLQDTQLLHFLNRFAPTKRDLQYSYWLENVAEDWAYMVSRTTNTSDLRKRLNKVHATEEGFAEFLPHVGSFLGALGERANGLFGYVVPLQPIIPVIHMQIDDQQHITWRHEPLSNMEERVIVNKVAEVDPDQQITRILSSSTLNRYLGMSVPAYIHSDGTSHWPPRKRRQDMSIAQVPVLNFQKVDEHANKLFVRSLIDFAVSGS